MNDNTTTMLRLLAWLSAQFGWISICRIRIQLASGRHGIELLDCDGKAAIIFDVLDSGDVIWTAGEHVPERLDMEAEPVDRTIGDLICDLIPLWREEL